jgi:hypothetical protein
MHRFLTIVMLATLALAAVATAYELRPLPGTEVPAIVLGTASTPRSRSRPKRTAVKRRDGHERGRRSREGPVRRSTPPAIAAQDATLPVRHSSGSAASSSRSSATSTGAEDDSARAPAAAPRASTVTSSASRGTAPAAAPPRAPAGGGLHDEDDERRGDGDDGDDDAGDGGGGGDGD